MGFLLLSIRRIIDKHAFVATAVIAWLIAIGAGVSVLMAYSYTPGRLAAPPREWPSGTTIHPAASRMTMIVFVHPQCPCSRATVGELAQIVAHYPGKLNANVVFYAPESKGASWVRSDLWADTTNIPGVHAAEDRDGLEARRFGAATSGQALLYDAQGQLMFNGGLTASRGHSGGNDGRDAVESLLQFGTAKNHTAPVFGCSLLGEK